MINKENIGFDKSVFTMKWFFTLFGYVFSVEQVLPCYQVFMDVEPNSIGGVQGDPRSDFGIAPLSAGPSKTVLSSCSIKTWTLSITSLASTRPANL